MRRQSGTQMPCTVSSVGHTPDGEPGLAHMDPTQNDREGSRMLQERKPVGGPRSIHSLHELIRLIAGEARVEILLRVAERPRTVSELCEVTELDPPLVSHHLRPLREAGIINVLREGKFRRYYLTPSVQLAVTDNAFQLSIDGQDGTRVVLGGPLEDPPGNGGRTSPMGTP